jgi:hypothetical protein
MPTPIRRAAAGPPKYIRAIDKTMNTFIIRVSARVAWRADVRDLVRHQTCQLRLAVGRQNHSAVYVELSARQSEGVNLGRVNYLDW